MTIYEAIIIIIHTFATDFSSSRLRKDFTASSGSHQKSPDIDAADLCAEWNVGLLAKGDSAVKLMLGPRICRIFAFFS
jgi:hypothetical protein